MSTEEKKWTQEELEAFLQEQEQEERQEQEWEDEYEPSLSDEDEDWADDEKRGKALVMEARERLRRENIEHYERQGFWLGREHQLLEELVEWLSRKRKEWKEVWRRIENKMWLKVKERHPNTSDCELWDEYWDKFRPSQVDECRHKFPWLVKEWNRYLETKELMLRKTRSKDVTGVIMSFC